MPPLVRRYIKTAIVCLVFGLLLGLHIGAAEYCGWGSLRQPYVVAHTHVLMLGFLLMLIMGVALWMFPQPEGQSRRVADPRAELAWWLVTVGVGVRTTGEIVSAYWMSHPLGIAIFCASACEALGVIVFFVNLWPRIRSPREALARRAAD